MIFMHVKLTVNPVMCTTVFANIINLKVLNPLDLAYIIDYKYV